MAENSVVDHYIEPIIIELHLRH